MGIGRDLMLADVSERRRYLDTREVGERRRILRATEKELGSVWYLFRDDLTGFIEVGLGEHIWSRQRQVLEAVEANPRVAVPSAFSTGKSWSAARIVAWWVSTWEPGTTLAITTAHRWRQVKNILWPYIRRLADTHRLPGDILLTQWNIGGGVVAFGLAANDADPDSIQGFHAPNVLVVIDEAGGIPLTLGTAFESLLAGANSKALAIGNPPMDDEASWFERICLDPDWTTIDIPAESTPNLTGERTLMCATCPRNVAPHPLSDHLVTGDWVTKQERDYGTDSPWYQSKVLARFPKGTPFSCVPSGALDDAIERAQPPDGGEGPAPDDTFAAGLPISLGVDVASSGGDELVVAVLEKARVRIAFTAAGPILANAVDVSGLILEEILKAEALAKERWLASGAEGVRPANTVKVDSVGVGWGVWSTLHAWGLEGRHASTVLRVDAGNRAMRPERFSNIKAEMWWNLRERCVNGDVALDVDEKTRAQIVSPRYSHNSSGRIVIESKEQLRRRGLRSPDRAEAVCIALYGPATVAYVDPTVGDWRLPPFNPERR